MKQLFSESDVDLWFEIFEEKSEAKIYTLLVDAGEAFVELAKESKTYHNQTNNLRSSIGYVIVKDGTVLKTNFSKSGDGTKGDGSEGYGKGRKLAIQIASGYKGFVLIGVAGMEYAIHVETKGFEVISSSGLQTEMLLKKSIQIIFNAANRNKANF